MSVLKAILATFVAQSVNAAYSQSATFDVAFYSGSETCAGTPATINDWATKHGGGPYNTGSCYELPFGYHANAGKKFFKISELECSSASGGQPVIYKWQEHSDANCNDAGVTDVIKTGNNCFPGDSSSDNNSMQIDNCEVAGGDSSNASSLSGNYFGFSQVVLSLTFVLMVASELVPQRIERDLGPGAVDGF